jgi:exonuclease SbcC
LSLFIKEVRIENFRSHSSSRIVFDSGINLISGRNGAGKSSVLEAILVALYGPRPTGLKKDDLVRDGTSGYTISLIFEIDGKEYSITRSSDGQSILSGDGFLLEGDSQINSWVEKVIAPSHVFTNAIYVRQGEIEGIIMDETSRERVIRKVTRIDDYENAWRNLGQVIREFEKEIEIYRNFLEQQESYELQKKEKEEDLLRRRKELDDSLKLRLTLENQLRNLEARKKEFDELAKNIQELEKQIGQTEGEIRILETEIKSLSERLERIKERIAELRRDVERAKLLEGKVREFERLETLLKNVLRTNQEIEEELNTVKRDQERWITELRRAEEDGKKLVEIRNRIKKITSKLSEIEGKVKEWERISERIKRKEEIERLLEEKGLDEEKILSMYSLVGKAMEELEKIREVSEKIAAKRASLITRGRQIQKSIEELKQAENYCPVCRRELTEEHKKELMKKYRKEIEEIRHELFGLEQKRKKIEEKKEKVERALQKQEMILRYKQFADEIRGIREELRETNIEELSEIKKEYDSLSEELGKLRGAETTLLQSANRIPEIQKELERIEARIKEIEKRKEELLTAVQNEGFSNIEELEKSVEILRHDYLEWQSVKDSSRKLQEEERNLRTVLERVELLRKEIEAKNRSLAEKREELKALVDKYSEEEHQKLDSEILEKNKQLAAVNETIQRLNELIGGLEKDLENIELMLTKINEYRRMAEVIESSVLPTLSKIREKFRQYKNMLMENVFKEVEINASEIFEEFTEGKYSGITLKQVSERGKEKLKIFVVYQGEEKEISFLSGGEMIALALAFRLALSMYMIHGKIPLLILDEPTPFLDEERRRKLVEITTSYFRRIPQVIVVSHDDELKDAADRVINIDFVGGTSMVSIAE